MTHSAGPGQPLRVSLTLGLLLSAILLFLAFREVDWIEMQATIRKGHAGYLLVAALALSVSYFLRGLRWRIILSAAKLIEPTTVFWATMAGYLGNNCLPARAGEVLRTVLIGRKTGISKSYVLATALTERILDVVALVTITFLVLMWVDQVPGWLLKTATGVAGLALICVVVVSVSPRMESVHERLLTHLPLPVQLHDKVLELLDHFLLGLTAFQHRGRALNFAGLTAVIWLVDGLVAIAVARAFQLALTFPVALLLLAALGLASALPSTPGYIGVYQFVAVTLLTPFNFSSNQALVYILAFQAVSYSVVALWGGVGLWRLGTAASKDAEVRQQGSHSVPQGDHSVGRV